MRFVLTRDASELAERAQPLLSERIEYNVLATVLLNVLEGAYGDIEPRFAYGVTDDGQVRFAALRTPPWPMLASQLEADEAPEFIDTWLRDDPGVSGVNGLAATARSIAEAWSTRTGGVSRCRMRQALHVLSQVVDPPRPAPGELRLPREPEYELLAGWLEAFVREAGVVSAGRGRQMLASYVSRGSLMIWDDGEPVSMVVANPPVAGAVRIGMVYTPESRRRRGYAGTAVAAMSRRALAQGATRCLLFADFANPTSNKIYAEVGYRRVADWEEHELVGGPSPP